MGEKSAYRTCDAHLNGVLNVRCQAAYNHPDEHEAEVPVAGGVAVVRWPFTSASTD